jgi:hypothetical protein
MKVEVLEMAGLEGLSSHHEKEIDSAGSRESGKCGLKFC